jgi:hypothetical protein
MRTHEEIPKKKKEKKRKTEWIMQINEISNMRES